ncbi:hypothetical protein KI387_017229, partial [Taxus chinensis]
GMTDEQALEEHIDKLIQLDERRAIKRWSHKKEKSRQKAWHDKDIKDKKLAVGKMVLLYDSKFLCQSGKLK